MKSSNICYFLLCGIFILPLYSFEIDPWAKLENRKVIDNKKVPSKPIHEILTNEVLSPSMDIDIKNVIRGVRWNDDPLNQLGHGIFNGIDFGLNFAHSCKNSNRIDSKYDLLYRTHCGDMQFLHAMASNKNEKAQETLDKIMMWLEFTYKVATGEVSHNYYFRSVPLKLEEKSSILFNNLILDNNKRRLKWQAEYMFTLSCNRLIKLRCKKEKNYEAKMIRDIALGSALHLIQDSYSNSHVLRETPYEEKKSIITNRGEIIGFYLYSQQDHKKHSLADKDYIIEKDDQMNNTVNMKEVMNFFIKSVLEDRMNNTNSWQKVKSKLISISFNLKNPGSEPIITGKYQKIPGAQY